MRALENVVSGPDGDLAPLLIEVEEQGLVGPLITHATVEALDEPVLHRLAGPGEVEDDALLIGPQIEIAADELRSLIDSDCLGVADRPAHTFEGYDHILPSITEPRIDGGREPREGVDDRQHPQFPARRELVVHEVHRPGLVDLHGGPAVFPQLRLHPALGYLVPELQAHLLVKSIDPLRVHRPAVTLQQDMHAPISVTDTGLANLLDAIPEVSLAAALRLVDIERSIDPERGAGTPRRNLPIAPHLVHQFALAGRLQNFFERTSCNMALSSDRSATIRFSLAFSSSS